METKNKVVVYLYDLSQGMAKQMSAMFLGKQIDGIWHTGVSVYGIEYYFGGGICKGNPKQTPYGLPVQELDMGETEIPQQDFEEYLSCISNQFTTQTYDIIKNNCNNFTDECLQFLVGTGLPDYIIKLPQEVLETPIGQQLLKPMIDQMNNQMVQQTQGYELYPQNNIPKVQTQTQKNNNGFDFGNIGNMQQQVQQDTITDYKKVSKLKDCEEFFEIMEKEKKIIIFFTALWCGPCKAIKPIYVQYSEDYQNIKFLLVECNQPSEIQEQFGISSYPTFITYLNGDQQQKWTGANQIKLKEKLDLLKQ